MVSILNIFLRFTNLILEFFWQTCIFGFSFYKQDLCMKALWFYAMYNMHTLTKLKLFRVSFTPTLIKFPDITWIIESRKAMNIIESTFAPFNFKSTNMYPLIFSVDMCVKWQGGCCLNVISIIIFWQHYDNII